MFSPICDRSCLMFCPFKLQVEVVVCTYELVGRKSIFPRVKDLCEKVNLQINWTVCSLLIVFLFLYITIMQRLITCYRFPLSITYRCNGDASMQSSIVFSETSSNNITLINTSRILLKNERVRNNKVSKRLLICDKI